MELMDLSGRQPTRKRPRMDPSFESNASRNINATNRSGRRRYAYENQAAASRDEMKHITKSVQMQMKAWNDPVADQNQLLWVLPEQVQQEVLPEGIWILAQNVARVPQGTAANQCDGVKYTVKNFQWRFCITASVPRQISSYMVRTIVFINRFSGPNPIKPSDVLERGGDRAGGPIAPGNEFPITSFTTIQGKPGFKILQDTCEQFQISSTSSDVANIPLTHLCQGFKSLNYVQEIVETRENNQVTARHTVGDNLCIMVCLAFPDQLQFGGEPPGIQKPFDVLNYTSSNDAIWQLSGFTRVGYVE